MGAVCGCLRVEDFEDYISRNSFVYRNCMCLGCFLPHFLHAYALLFRRGEVPALPSSIQGTAALTSSTSIDNSLSDIYRPPPRPLPYDTDPRYFRLQRDGLVSRREKGLSHSQSHEETEPLRRSDIGADSESLTPCDKWSSSGEDGSKEIRKTSLKLASRKSAADFAYVSSSSEDEDVCPTCLEEYTAENPRIMTKCSHHFHLGCIYEWMERSESCPVCGKVMTFEESP